jgi:hypothetical protein
MISTFTDPLRFDSDRRPFTFMLQRQRRLLKEGDS